MPTDHTALRALDRQLAETLGWRVEQVWGFGPFATPVFALVDPTGHEPGTSYRSDEAERCWLDVPAFSADWATMGWLIEEMAKRGFWWVCKSPFGCGHNSWFAGFTPLGVTGWNGRPDFTGSGASGQEGTARAALAALTGKEVTDA